MLLIIHTLFFQDITGFQFISMFTSIVNVKLCKKSRIKVKVSDKFILITENIFSL